jgi:hypothetical protein
MDGEGMRKQTKQTKQTNTEELKERRAAEAAKRGENPPFGRGIGDRRGDRITTFFLQRRMSAFGTKRTSRG